MKISKRNEKSIAHGGLPGEVRRSHGKAGKARGEFADMI